MNKGWMIRAGRGGKFFKEFEEGHYVAVGWNKLGSLIQYSDIESIREAYLNIYGNEKPAKTGNSIAMIRKFRFDIQKGDYLVTYNPKKREYKIGLDLGEYVYRERANDEYAQTRQVNWIGEVKRDQLTQKSKNSLSSVLTLFSLNNEIFKELVRLMNANRSKRQKK